MVLLSRMMWMLRFSFFLSRHSPCYVRPTSTGESDAHIIFMSVCAHTSTVFLVGIY